MNRTSGYTAMLALMLAGCASTPLANKPFSAIDASRSLPADPLIHPAIIVAIDGQYYASGLVAKDIGPGFHYIDVASTALGSAARLNTRPLAINAQPCMRYFIAAKHPSRLTLKNWQVVVIAEESIGYCSTKSLAGSTDGR